MLAAGCAEIQNELTHVRGVYPGLPPPPPPPEPPPFVIDVPQPPVLPLPELAMPFPPARLDRTQAATALAGDPMALRFLALRALTEEGLLPIPEAVSRREANLGALLPLTSATRPPVEAELPIPPLPRLLDRFRSLDPESAERAFLLDQILGADPTRRVDLAPHDKVSGRKVLDRLARLEDAGLITPEERRREAGAVEALVATLPEVLLPPPEPEKPKPAKRKVAGKGGTGTAGTGARRLEGGVTGRLEVIPSPTIFEAPKIDAGFAGKAGVHLLSMATAAYGDKAWEALTNQFKQELAGLSFTVQRADLGELGVTYRLVAGPLEPAAAERLCGVIRQKGQACMPTPWPQ